MLISWENEAFLSIAEYPGQYEIVVPSKSILCQPTVAIVDEVVDQRGTRQVAKDYLDYLYSDDAQRVEAKWYYRPSNLSRNHLQHQGRGQNQESGSLCKNGRHADFHDVPSQDSGNFRRTYGVRNGSGYAMRHSQLG